MKKKKIIVAIFFVILVGICAVLKLKSNDSFMTTEITAYKWSEKDTNLILRINADEVYIDDMSLVTSFHSKMDQKDIVKTNSNGYVGQILYCDGSKELLSASLFLMDDNYYVLFCNDATKESYVLQNCHLSYGLSGEMIVAPSPVHIVIDEELFELLREEGINELDFLFDNCTFEEAKIFYERLSGEYITIDEEQQQITVDAYDVKNDVFYEKYITIDFKNRTITGVDEKGKKITVNGN